MKAHRLLLLGSLFLAGCRTPGGDRPAVVEVTAAAPPEAQLAALQAGHAHVSRALVIEFAEVLTALERRCTETRVSVPSLGDIARQSVAAVKSEQPEMTLLNALRTLESSIHEGADMKIDCAAAARRLFGS